MSGEEARRARDELLGQYTSSDLGEVLGLRPGAIQISGHFDDVGQDNLDRLAGVIGLLLEALANPSVWVNRFDLDTHYGVEHDPANSTPLAMGLRYTGHRTYTLTVHTLPSLKSAKSEEPA